VTDRDAFEAAYLVACVAFHSLLIAHFALRAWRLEVAVRHGWLVYASAVPFAALSGVTLAAGSPWWLWAGGFAYLVWGGFGFVVEYVARLEWRSPIRWRILVPYVLLYLATAMLYWWPVALVSRPLWYALGASFLVSSGLNIAAHRRRAGHAPAG
jgi:hypothetical protein